MKHSTQPTSKRHFSARTALIALGLWLKQQKIWAPIEEKVDIHQKTLKHTPVQKLFDAFIALLAGAQGLVEINKRVRSDPALQRAFGREACAEQSVVQETLDACTPDNVVQMQQAVDIAFQKHSQACRHDYQANWQLLDIDMTGNPCGRKCEFASKGYFAHQPNRRGRQLGRVLATHSHEIVVDRLFDGKTQLARAFLPLMQAAQKTLDLDAQKCAHTILRVDAGGGTIDDINWALSQGYAYHGKDYVAHRAQNLAATVTDWIEDPKVLGRQVGWVVCQDNLYVRPVVRIAVRCAKKNGQWGVGVLVSTLSAEDVILLTRQPIDKVGDPKAVLLAYVYFYDARGGGVESSFKEDKQGLGLTKRNKKRFLAQQMLVALTSLAHNVFVWARAVLSKACPKLARLGILRLVRDLFTTSGWVQINSRGRITQITLNQDDQMAQWLVISLPALLRRLNVDVNLGET